MDATRHPALTLLLSLLLCSSVQAQFPTLESVRPRGCMRGAEVELQLRGKQLGEAQSLLFDGPGIEVLSLKQSKPKKLTAKLLVAEDCPLGPRAVWVRTPKGLSNLGTFSVGALNELEELEPNGSRQSAQAIAMDVTVNGVAESEDVDFFAFEGRAGERVSVEIEGLRLGDRLFDPSIALLDEAGFALASCDDAPIARQDAALSLLLPADGRYFLQVRESSYQGGKDFRYRLHLGHFPRPLATLPSGGASGEQLELELIDATASDGHVSVIVPEQRAGGGWCPPGVVAFHAHDEGGIAPSPNWLRVSSLPRVLAVESNEGPQRVSVPVALEGVLEAPGDVDRFIFAAEKGARYDVTVWARRMRSPLDSVLEVFREGGKRVGSNDDDDGQPDSRVRFKVDSDGEYRVSVRDQLGRGGREFTYRVEVSPVSPSLSASIDEELQRVAVPRGGRTALLLRADRREQGGELQLALAGLPPGVRASIPNIPGGGDTTLALFEADADADPAATLSEVHIQTPGGEVRGELWHEVELVRGQNQSRYWAHTIDRLPVAVTEPAPFSLAIAPLAVPLVRGGYQTLAVSIERAEGFDGEVSLRLPWVPSGVSTNQQRKLAKGETSASFELNASSSASLGVHSILVTGEAETSGGRVRVASSFAPLEVARPFVSFTAQAVSAERGQPAQMFVEVSRLDGFRGVAEVELLGLPPEVRSEELRLDDTTESLVFPILTAAGSPLGKHKGLSFRARFLVEEGVVPHTLAAAELRIQPTPEGAPAPAPAPVEASAPRPRSRLEELREHHPALLEARRRAEEAALAPAQEAEAAPGAPSPTPEGAGDREEATP